VSGADDSLKAQVCADDILIVPGIHDGYSARLIDQAGFSVAIAGGSGLSESRLGWADRGILGLHDNVNAVRDLASCAPGLKIIADGDTGYGNAVNVHFTVRAFEQAGASAVLIEDQVWPKRCGHMAGKAVIDVDEAAEKISAAVEAREKPEFLIVARTDSAATDGLREAITRLNRFEEVGADVLFADALLSADDIRTVAQETQKPLLVNMGLGLRQRPTTPLISPKALQELGAAAVIYPRLLTAAALKGMMNALDVFQQNVLNENKTPDRDDLLASFDEINRLTGMAQLDALEKVRDS